MEYFRLIARDAGKRRAQARSDDHVDEKREREGDDQKPARASGIHRWSHHFEK